MTSKTSKTAQIAKLQADLAAAQRRTMELEASLASTCHFASQDLKNCGDNLTASGAVVQIVALGGRQLMRPVLIRDGLSKDTIAALRADLQRSYDLAVIFKP